MLSYISLLVFTYGEAVGYRLDIFSFFFFLVALVDAMMYSIPIMYAMPMVDPLLMVDPSPMVDPLPWWTPCTYPSLFSPSLSSKHVQSSSP